MTFTVRRRDGNIEQLPIYSRRPSASQYVEAVYMTKALPDGSVEVYCRSYGLLGHLVDPGQMALVLSRYIVDTWKDYTGGASQVPGRATWLQSRR